MGQKRLKPIRDEHSPAGVVAGFLRGLYTGNADLTLTRLAADTGYSQASLSEALSGKVMPSLDLVIAFVEGCGRDDAVVEAGHVWRREKARSQGSTRPPRPERADSWESLHDEVVLLAHESGVFRAKALCDAAAAAGHPMTHTSAHRWLTTARPLRLDSLDTILNACKVPMRQREPWVRAHDRAADNAGAVRASFQGTACLPTGSLSHEALAEELRRMRRGAGVHAPDLKDAVGPVLRELCDLTDFDGAEVVRRKVGEWVHSVAGGLPADVRVTVLTALGLNPDAPHRVFRERVEWLAAQQDRSPGTSRRRIDEALTRMAEAAVAAPRPALMTSREHAWHVRAFEAVLSLDGTTPRCTESRTIVADRDGLDRITWSLTLPRNGDDSPGELDVTVLHGAQLLSKERPSPRRFVLGLGLPRRLRSGEVHDFVLQVSVPNGRLSPRYVFWPERRCERFRLVSRFGSRKPAAVWRVDHVFHRDADEIETGRDYVSVDDGGEVRAAFAELQAGHGYGIRWAW
ncbi:helix-turn-helix transcriptional regulator [Lentzea sp. NPDC042327]|uniref:helix-turn-helix domain-containing protein n=1 Tax=Lentzea sp. NPDC042327 TaxID=3154801 RepID=UPI0034115A38